MDVLVVVAAVLQLLLGGPGAERLADVAVGVLAADHEADLARGVGGDGGVGVLGDGEDRLAVLLELGNQVKVEPLVLGYRFKCTAPQNRARKAGWLRGGAIPLAYVLCVVNEWKQCGSWTGELRGNVTE